MGKRKLSYIGFYTCMLLHMLGLASVFSQNDTVLVYFNPPIYFGNDLLNDEARIYASFTGDSIWASGDAWYNPTDSAVVLELGVSSGFTLDQFKDEIIYEIHYKGSVCTAFAENVSSQIISDYELSVESVFFRNYEIYYAEGLHCEYGDNIPLITDIPNNDFTATSDSDSLVFDENYNIVVLESAPCFYKVQINTMYCIYGKLDSDSLELSVTVPDSLYFGVDIFPDTVRQCAGSHLDTSFLEGSGYSLYEGNIDSDTSLDFQAGTIYNIVAVPTDIMGHCMVYDTIHVEVVGASLASTNVNVNKNCLTSIVNIESADSNISDVKWGNGSVGTSIVVDNNQWVSYVVSDIYGCNSQDSVYVEVLMPPVFEMVQENKCFSTRVSLDILDGNVSEVYWNKLTKGDAIEIEEPEMVLVEVFDENGCIGTDSFFFDIVPLKVETLDYSKEEADCWKDGKLIVNQIATNYGASGLNYTLKNTLNNNVVNDLDNIPDGLYQIEVTNEDNCKIVVEDAITIKQKCLEDYPVFSPNQDGQEDEFFIPHEGSVQVIDRNGVLVKELDTPVYWDGTDMEGKPLPMGNYLIVTDTGRPVNITIVR